MDTVFYRAISIVPLKPICLLSEHPLLIRQYFYTPFTAVFQSLTFMCSCSWASCCRESCSCCLWNSAMRICLWICCFCLRARSSCWSCCSRSVGSVTGMENWWSKRRSIGTEVGATCKGSVAVTSTAKLKNTTMISLLGIQLWLQPPGYCALNLLGTTAFEPGLPLFISHVVKDAQKRFVYLFIHWDVILFKKQIMPCTTL